MNDKEMKERRRQLELDNKRLRNTNSKSYAKIRFENADHARVIKLERDAIALNEAQIQKNQEEFETLGIHLSNYKTPSPSA